MNKFKVTITLSGIILLSSILSSCELLGTEDDPCDATVAPEKSFTIQATVQDDFGGEDTWVTVSIHKEPCGAPSKGFFDYADNVTDGTYRMPAIVGYDLRNKNDVVVVTVTATNPWGDCIPPSQSQRYTYDDVIDGLKYEPVFLVSIP